VALDQIGDDLVWSEADQGILGGLLMGIFLVSYGFSNIFLSPNIDKYGSKIVLTVSLIGCSFSVFLGAFFGHIYSVFLLTRLLLGLTQGVMFPVASKVIGGWYKKEDRAKANSIFMIGSPVGVALAPMIMAPVIDAVSWEASFYLVALIGFALALPILLFMGDSPSDLKTKQTKNEDFEMKKAFKKHLKMEEFRLTVIGFTAVTSVWWGITLWVPSYLEHVHQIEISELTYIGAIPYFGAIFGLYIGSWLSDRTGKTNKIILFSLFMAGTLIALLTMLPIPGLRTALLLLFLVFLFGQLAPPLFFTKIQNTITEEELGSGTGLMNGIANFVGILGPVLVGIVVGLTSSYDYGLLSLSFIAFLGLIGFYISL